MKKELIEKITSRCLGKIAKEHIKQILSEELPDFQRIDEERMGKILNNIVGSSIYYDQLLQKSVTLEAVRIYNSTLSKAPAQPPALKPLPKEMPKDLTRFAMGHDVYEVWDKIISEYGTPEPKPSLPTVEELAKEMLNVWNVNTFNEVAEYVINKYSLKPSEWWQDCEKFILGGTTVKNCDGYKVYKDGSIYLISDNDSCNIIYCTPYTHPTADDIIAKYKISEEEVRLIREGK